MPARSTRRFLAVLAAIAVGTAAVAACRPQRRDSRLAPGSTAASTRRAVRDAAPERTAGRASTTTAAPSTTPAPAAPTTAAADALARRAGPGAGWWRPEPGLSWQIQLSGNVDQSVDAAVYDIDGEAASAALVSALHARGRKVICYLDAGAAESYRADAGLIPASALGEVVDGWPEERWLDIRQIEALRPVMSARMDLCKAKGFDAVDPDMVEAYTADSGFPLTATDQLRYNRFLAQLAHERGLAVGLKNDLGQVDELVADFDFAVNEQCAEYDECDALAPFIASGKPVFHIEYDTSTARTCAEGARLGFSSLRKRLDLGAWREAC